MSKIIISYRRADSQAVSGRIFDRLVSHFGKKSVFMDIDDIPFGIDFRPHIQSVLSEADVLIAVVGPGWLGAGEDDRPRMHAEDDPVRIEIETALRNKIHVIPILVNGATMPAPALLPDSIKRFSFINAAPVDAGRDFNLHVGRLIHSIEAMRGQSVPSARRRSYARWRLVVIGIVVLLAIGAAWWQVESSLMPSPSATVAASAPEPAAPASPNAAQSSQPRVGRDQILPAASTANTLPPADAAERAWAAVQNTTDRAALEDFVRRFGDTPYADLARGRLAALPANPSPPADAAERAWAAVQNTADRAALEDFVRRFGDTPYADLARGRLAALPANPPPPADAAERAWAAVQNTTDRAALEDFVRRFGNTPYANLARGRLAALPANPPPPADAAERAWAAVQNTTDRAALEDFVRRFGNSAYAILARARLAALTGGTPEQEIAFVRDCDRLAANPDDAARRSGVAGTRWDLIDPMQAVPACRAATAARPDDPRLMYQLGRVLDKQGASTQALSWYRKAADGGYLEAMNNLGIMYTNGRGVRRDDAEALRLFRKAVDGGSADAITNLGFMYHYGRGVAPNLEEAVRLFRKAADAGSAEGMYWLGLVHEIGAGVRKDDAEAFKWYRNAADRGVASAMNKLGVMYSSGTGVGKDMTEAVRWYRAAAAAGNVDAKANLTRLGN